MTTTTWTDGGGDHQWASPPGDPTLNFDTLFIPTQSDAVVIDNATAVAITVGGTPECASLNCTGFLGTLFASGNDFKVWGNVTFSAGMTLPDINLLVQADMTLVCAGQSLAQLVGKFSTPNIDITLADNLNCAYLEHAGSGAVLNMAGHTINLTATATHASAEFYFDPATTVNYSAGAKIVMNGAGHLGGTTAALPEIEIIGGMGTVDNYGGAGVKLHTEKFTLTSGTYDCASENLEVDGDCTLTSGSITNVDTVIVGGNFATQISLPAGVYNVTGTAVASGTPGTITGANFNGGTKLYAPGWTDGGGNDNVDFTVPPVIWDGSESNLTSVADNWTPSGVPDATKDVVINDDTSGSILGSISCKSADFTDYAGSFDGSIEASGDIILSEEMTFVVNGVLGFIDDGSLTTAGQVCKYVNADGCTVTLNDDVATYKDGIVSENGAVFDFGTHTVTTTSTLSEDGWYFEDTSTIDYDAGAKLISLGEIGAYTDLEIVNAATKAPPIEVNGDAQLYIYSGSHMSDLTVNSGGWYLEDETYSFTGDVALLGGEMSQDLGTPDMAGAVVVVEGDFTADGVTLNNGTLDVGGTATCSNCTISNMTSTGPVDCADNCIDGGGNDENFFADGVVSVTTDHANGEVVASGTINIDVEFEGNQDVAGTPKLYLLMRNNVLRAVNYTSGTGTDTLRFVFTVGANDKFDVLRTHSLVLNGGTITDEQGLDSNLTLPEWSDEGGLNADVGSEDISTGYQANFRPRRFRI